MASYNPNVLREALRSRSLTPAALSERLGVSRQDVEDALEPEPEPRQALLNEIARELALPAFVFFMSEPPPLKDIITDFRSPTPRRTPKSRQTLESIQLAAAIQEAAGHLRAQPARELPRFEAAGRSEIDAFALAMRGALRISVEDQAEAADASAFYNICRKKIEDLGIFVIHESFPETDGSGFCLADPEYPVVVVNTRKQTRGRRLFTLLHELAHVLMGETGISDPFVRENTIERRCNQFAGSFLVPRPYVAVLLQNCSVPRNPSIDDVASLARRLKISQQAAVLRLEELDLVQAGSHSRWLAAIRNVGNPDYSSGGGGGGQTPQEKVKLAKYGFHFATAFDAPLRTGQISEINLYRLSGLKPKFQRAYFDYAKSITDSQLQALELDDEV